MSVIEGKATVPQTIVLHYAIEEGKVRIVPPDKDIMAMSVEMAIEACRAFRQQIQFKDQFELLLKRLVEWVSEHAADVHKAFLTRRDSGLLFLVVLNTEQFDPIIEDSLTDLDLEIANDADFKLITLSVHALPCCSEDAIGSFVSHKQWLESRSDAKRS